MSMLVPIVLVVGTFTMAMLFIPVPSFMCVNWKTYIAHSHNFLDVVCTHCLPIKTKNGQNIAVDVYPCIKCGEC